jgi:hypothetical protein
MNKRWLPGLAALILAGIALVTGYWKFPGIPFSVPVKLSSGETALVSGSVPVTAWQGENTELKMTFQFTSPVPAGKTQLQAKIVMPDVTINPAGQLSLILDPSEAMVLKWTMVPQKTGDLEGTLWVSSAVGGGTLQAVLARRFQIHAVSVLGISATWIRRIGLGFLFLGVFYLSAFANRSKRAKA